MTAAPTIVRPDHDDARRAFRRCVGAFPTGVTIVTAEHEGALAGMTLNSFVSVSLSPLLVVVSLAHGTRTLMCATQSGRYCVSVLGRDQEDVARAFAANGAPTPIGLLDAAGDGFAPVRDALAVIRCSVADVHVAGDHSLLVGTVEDFSVASGDPLVFHQGLFGGLDVAPVPADRASAA